MSVESRAGEEVVLRGLGIEFAGILPSWLSAVMSLSRAPAQVLVQMHVQEMGRLCSFQKPCDRRVLPRARLGLLGVPRGKTLLPLPGYGHRRPFVPLGNGSRAAL